MTLSGSPHETNRIGKYPNAVTFTVLPALVPWQRKQLSNWLTAGLTAVMPSTALIPAVPFCDARIAGGLLNAVVCWDACGLWQSTQVACRLLLSSADSARSCRLLVEGTGCAPVFANSPYTFKVAGWVFEPAWHAMQSCSFTLRNRRAGPEALCGMWQALQPFCATVP